MNLRRRPRHADNGASLILVLIVISVISLVMSVILAQADTAVRSTVALRDQASTNYGGDGATNAVLNALKTSGINCNDPTTPTPVTLGSAATPFYVPDNSSGAALDAYAECTADRLQGTTSAVTVSASTSLSTPAPVTSTSAFLGQGDSTLPNYAVLTTGSGQNDFGLDFSGSSNNTSVFIQDGSVASNSSINATSECLIVRLSKNGGDTNSNCNQITNFGSGIDSSTNTQLVVRAHASCQGGSTAFRPTSCTANSPSVAIPDLPTVSSSSSLPAPPVCSASGNPRYAALFPGYYGDSTTLAYLNAPCGAIGNSGLVEWLTPGNYYFNYASSTASTQWNWPSKVIAGTPTTDAAGTQVGGLYPVTPTSVTNLSQAAAGPNACADPAQSANESGVTMVFGGASYVNASTTTGNFAQLCASSTVANGAPPLAMYGLTAPLALTGPSGFSATVPAETLCSAVGCGGTSGTSLINTSYSDNSGHASVYIKGYVYAPQAQMLLRLLNAQGQIFNWGVIVRDLALVLNGSSPNQPVFKLPRPNTGIGTTATTSTPAPSTIISTVTATVTSYTIRYINVWTCAPSQLQSGQCPHSGLPNVQVKVRTSGPTLQILSWSHVR